MRSEFPCLNDILQMVKKYETALPVMEVEFLKELKLIDWVCLENYYADFLRYIGILSFVDIPELTKSH